jgi:hypothetical protein
MKIDTSEVNHSNLCRVLKRNFKCEAENVHQVTKKTKVCTMCHSDDHRRAECPLIIEDFMSNIIEADKEKPDESVPLLKSSEASQQNRDDSLSSVKSYEADRKKPDESPPKLKKSEANRDIHESSPPYMKSSEPDTDKPDESPFVESCDGKDEEIVTLLGTTYPPLINLEKEFTEVEKNVIHNAIYGQGPDDEVLVQSSTGDKIVRNSMRRLKPGSWLNDEAIHYFYVLLRRRDAKVCRKYPGKRRSHFFKSFFFSKLLDEGNTDEYKYANVRSWSRVSFVYFLNFNLYSLDY